MGFRIRIGVVFRDQNRGRILGSRLRTGFKTGVGVGFRGVWVRGRGGGRGSGLRWVGFRGRCRVSKSMLGSGSGLGFEVGGQVLRSG
ncbi:hypothetical protein TIFTF001_009775 [Ficus carica]|uniref:Uncharacterized protein n=1 Tax=Ficus carica TaxID=3494 RepID=A0AA88AB03_FICCA|nr:hypothetical protein TIFTF001_009775 [Ficus carica]